MINFDDVIEKLMKDDNPIWLQIPDHLSKILIIRGSRSGKANSSFNIINQQPGIDKIHLYAKDHYEVKHQLLIINEKVQA